jgi:single-strand DNA-binding protein
MSFNKALIMGNLTRDPELKVLPSGAKVCNLSLATNRTWKDAQGVKQEAVDYHGISVFGISAENSAKYLKKGSSVFVEGRIQTRSWEGTDGKKQYKTEIIADSVNFLSRASEGSSAQSSGTGPSQAGYAAAPMPAANEAPDFDMVDFGSEPNLEDIPF